MNIYLRNFFSELRRYKISAQLNMLGLTLALGTSYIFLAHTYYHLTFNHGVDGAERTYKLVDYVPVCKKMGESQLVEQSGAQTATFYQFLHIALPGKEDQPALEWRFILGEPSFPSTYGFQLQEGSEKSLASPHSVLISARCSKKYGLKVGDVINIEDANRLMTNVSQHRVAGIFKDMPLNSDFAEVDLFVSQEIPAALYTSYNNTNNRFYFRLHQDKDIEEFRNFCNRVKYAEYLKIGYFTDTLTFDKFKEEQGVQLVPVSKTHLYDLKNRKMGNDIQSDNYTLLCFAVGLLILAFFNYFNFFMATLPTRIRRYNTEKIFGRRISQIRLGIVLDTTGQVLFTFIPALLLILWLSPWLAEHQLTSVSLRLADNLPVLLGIGLSSIVLAVFVSLYPAHYVSSIPTAMALQRSFGHSTTGRRLRHALLTLQFVVSFAFLGNAAFVQLQYRFMTNGNLGFDRNNLYTLSFEDPHHKGNSCKIPNSALLQQQLKQEILKHPMVEDMTFSIFDLTSRDPNGFNGAVYRGEYVELLRMEVAPNFFSFMKMKKADGSSFSEDDFLPGTQSLVVSENAQKKHQMDLTANNKELFWNYPVVGICKDVRLHAMLYDKQEIGWVVNNKIWNGFRHFYFRVSPHADVKEVEEWIKTCILKLDTRLQEENLRFRAFDSDIKAIYQQEQRENMTYTLFGIVALGLPLMGIFGLVLFDTQYRRREMAIRRINGARTVDILRMFLLQYIKLVGIAFVLSFPLTYLWVKDYLEGFVEHISISIWPFLTILLTIAGITAAIVTAQVYRTVHEKPTEVLNHE